ncbi:hypothetical protein [Ktedonobacter racemifer]|uniref:Uncharacterized protein n=1 Tax=Ktedonobacter racemifer DSM 44963 TaxID=485913 RepID=D6U385_KTERA|nr:hypothetical protein [Ktedonobacter racemifer]EFH81089.1 hypothetical protein Krac_1767 [Ktedonobacter racemifer DSM 44963]
MMGCLQTSASYRQRQDTRNAGKTQHLIGTVDLFQSIHGADKGSYQRCGPSRSFLVARPSDQGIFTRRESIPSRRDSSHEGLTVFSLSSARAANATRGTNSEREEVFIEQTRRCLVHPFTQDDQIDSERAMVLLDAGRPAPVRAWCVIIPRS